MTARVRATDPDSPLSEELQEGLLEALRSGLMPRYVALINGVAPKLLYAWLDDGAKRDALQPYRAFCVAWVKAESELMQQTLAVAKAGTYGAREAWLYLERRWPKVWGKEADVPFEPLQPVASNAEEQEQLEAILLDPASFGVLELFAKYDRLNAKEREALAPQIKPTG